MPGLISIGRKYERSPETYGLSSAVGVSNMKSALVRLVIVLSLAASTSCDSQTYPGRRFNFNSDRRPRFKKLDRSSQYDNFRFKLPLEEYRETKDNLPPFDSLPETIRQLREIISWEKEQLNDFNENRLKMYRFELERAAFRAANRADDFFKRPMLDEARMYPQDDDFAFDNEDDTSDEDDNVMDRPDVGVGYEERRNFAGTEPFPSTARHEPRPNRESITEEFPQGRFKNVKMVTNPNEFAYAPPNPMFYRSVEVQTPSAPNRYPDSSITIALPTPSTMTTDEVKISERSEVKYGTVINEVDDSQISNMEEGILEGDNNLEVVAVNPEMSDVDSAGVYIIAVVAGISAAATVGLIAVGIGWYNLKKHAKNGGDLDYPAYGVTGPNKDLSPTGERRLAQSAQMYHYQHQKQQIISMERVQPSDRRGSVSDAESDEENEEGDYTVYECPGLAPTGEMEVKNPLFQDDPTPAQATPSKPSHDSAHK